MFFTETTFIGIDLTKSPVYAALDKGLNLLALGEGELDDVAAFVGGQQSAVVAVNAPSGVSRGLARSSTGRSLLAQQKTRKTEMRLVESELRAHGIQVYATPSTVGACASWVRSGFDFYRRLGKMGFKKYPQEDEPRQVLETNAHACFCVMSGSVPLSASSLEGRLQRQLILYECGLRIKDPMDFFEEITRHKLLNGILPVDLLYSPERLNALIAAYTAWLAINKKERVSILGDSKEGQIFLPEKDLKERY